MARYDQGPDTVHATVSTLRLSRRGICLNGKASGERSRVPVHSPSGVRSLHSPVMRRTAILLVTLLAMLWQATALARPGSAVNVMADLEHAALHWQQEGHHHHEDGSVHLDDSQASTLHILGDQLTVTAALLPSSEQHFPPSAAGQPGIPGDARVPDPFLDGLLRPPRTHS